jgi:TolB-like protein
MKRPASALLLLLALVTTIWAARPEDGVKTLCDSLLAGLPDSLGEARVAVIPFTCAAGQKPDQGLAVAEYVITLISKDKRLKLVDRTEFQKVVAELALSESDMVDPGKVLQVGKLLSANYLLTGTISDAFGMSRVSAKIIRTESSEIVSSASIAIAPASLQGLTKELLGEKTKVSASAFRSLIVPGWGQFYSRKYVRGGVWLAAGLGGLGTTFAFGAQTSARNHEYDDYDKRYWSRENPSVVATREAMEKAGGVATGSAYYDALDAIFDKKDALYEDYSTAFDHLVLAGSITGGIWALNFLDAIIAGAQEKKKFRPYFAGRVGGEIEAGLAVRF